MWLCQIIPGKKSLNKYRVEQGLAELLHRNIVYSLIRVLNYI